MEHLFTNIKMARSEAIAAVSASKPKVDDDSGLCWRKEVDQNLKRLQWLLFGADTALEKGDEAFILSIREAVSKLVSARRASIPDSDRLQRSDYVCWRVGGADVNANTDAVDIEGAGADLPPMRMQWILRGLVLTLTPMRMQWILRGLVLTLTPMRMQRILTLRGCARPNIGEQD